MTREEMIKKIMMMDYDNWSYDRLDTFSIAELETLLNSYLEDLNGK